MARPRIQSNCRARHAVRWLSVAFAAAAGCAPALRYPYSATQLARDSSERGPEALVHYLGQKHADPAVCSAERTEAHVPAPSGESVAAVLQALVGGSVAPQPAAACVAQAVPRLQGPAYARAT
jgi:hypothetical protein